MTTWGAGDYAEMAARLEPAAELLVGAAGVRAGERVLDLACGTGNAAIAAARRGAHATGVDFEPALLAIARERAPELEWLQADMLAPPPARFDAVVSAFGVMYAPDHAAAVRALLDACEPGGRVGLTAWTPGSFMPAMGAALAPYLPPPPPGGAPPSRWGDADALAELLDAGGLRLTDAATHTVALDFEDPGPAVGFLIRTAGHVVAERPRLEGQGRWHDLVEALERLVDGRTRLELDYLLAVAEPRPAR